MNDYNFFANALIEKKPKLFNDIRSFTMSLFNKSQPILDNDYCKISTLEELNNKSLFNIVFYEDKKQELVYLYLLEKNSNKSLYESLEIIDKFKQVYIFKPFILQFPSNNNLTAINNELSMCKSMLHLFNNAFLNYFNKSQTEQNHFIENSGYPIEVLNEFLCNSDKATQLQHHFQKIQTANNFKSFTLSINPSYLLDYIEYLNNNNAYKSTISKEDIICICSEGFEHYQNELISWFDTIEKIENTCSLNHYSQDNPLNYYEDCAMWKDDNLITLIDSNSFTIIEKKNNDIIFYFSHFENYDESQKYNNMINKINNAQVDSIRDIAMIVKDNQIVYCFQEPSYLVQCHLETFNGYLQESSFT